ncbi:DUF2868 domain-containing protein [Pseudoduganella umbonata]|uniref:DUF2868 domain-containing protein n=1 Tax=Pseudoduganella umbonata TaxID=864828 RepID=A0A4P8HZ21_9BURK|nr:DUF2868 domain-containing protein [Pseudoduganella umbonata]MBB3224201.1 hypothetical protein [Pseudoduganella umbonata]QCP13940.1 DUF2868 domain-containing protein [Pseudoduganella umbonata]
MNEELARSVVLVRAIETTDQKREILSDDDRRYANRTARELAQWQASETRAEATSEHFLQQRSEQVIKKLSQRHPAFAAFAKRAPGLHATAWLLPLLALLLGAGLDRITDPHRVDLLSAPLLAIIAWNLLVYVAMLVWLCIPKAGVTRMRAAWIRHLAVGKGAMPRKMPHALSSSLYAFMADWAQLSARLNGARLSRTVHLSAALFAVGALASLYARGMLSQYGAGWESTFLGAQQVHELLAILFWPAIAVFGLQGFTLADVQALHYAAGAPAAASSGARWVHLYAGTLLLLVVLPRLVFTAFAAVKASVLKRRFPLDLDQSYFRQLHTAAGGEAGTLRVLPYSFTVDEARARGLEAVAAQLLGERARVRLLAAVAYSADPAAALGTVDPRDPGVTSTALLFSLAATPEKENHGAFITQAARSLGVRIPVLLDESAFSTRTPDPQRVRDRIELWREFCVFHGADPTVVNLLASPAQVKGEGA